MPGVDESKTWKQRSGTRLRSCHVDCLQTLRPLLDFELDDLVLEETPAAFTADLRVVHEDIGAVVLLDEAPTLLVIEPLDPADCHIHASTSNCNFCSYCG